MIINYLAEKIASKKMYCHFFNHHYVEIKKVNNHFKEFECIHCKHQVTNDNKGKKIELTSELKDINKMLSYLYLKREFLSHFYFSRNQ